MMATGLPMQICEEHDGQLRGWVGMGEELSPWLQLFSVTAVRGLHPRPGVGRVTSPPKPVAKTTLSELRLEKSHLGL